MKPSKLRLSLVELRAKKKKVKKLFRRKEGRADQHVVAKKLCGAYPLQNSAEKDNTAAPRVQQPVSVEKTGDSMLQQPIEEEEPGAPLLEQLARAKKTASWRGSLSSLLCQSAKLLVF